MILLFSSILAFVFGEGPVREWAARFNADDEELYTNAVANCEAADFLLRNVPRFECPDEDIVRTYYFRWWTYRKHLKRTPSRANGPSGWEGRDSAPRES